MEPLHESYRLIELWCRPLKRTRYSFRDMKKAVPKADSTSTLLLKRVRENERRAVEASGILERPAVRDEADDEYTSALSVLSESYMAFDTANPLENTPGTPHGVQMQELLEQLPPEKKPRLRRLRAKIDDRLFDYSEIEQEKIEQDVDALVNADGYYNEVEPIDIDSDYNPKPQINTPALIAAALLLVYIVIILII